MAKNPKEAEDRGYRDRVKHDRATQRDDAVTGTLREIGKLIDGQFDYRGDPDYPESYREGWREAGRKELNRT